MGHLGGEAGLLDGGDGVTTANDGDAALAGELGEGGGNSVGALGEGVELEDTHGAVPDDGLAVSEASLELSDGLRSDIKTHPALRDLVNINDLSRGISGELISDDDVGGEVELDALLGGDLLELLGELKLVILDKGLADVVAAGLQEGENHATTQDELVDLLKHRLDDGDLGGDLGATDDGSEGALGLVDGTLEVVELLLEKVAGDGGLEVGGDTLGGAVGAVSSAEGVVDVEISVGGELLGELSVVLLLLGVEANVLEENDVTVGHLGDGLTDRDANAVRDKLNGLAKELGKTRGDGGKGELGLVATLGAAKVGGEEDLGTLGGEVLDGGDSTADTGIIGDLSSTLLKRHVEVNTNQDSEKNQQEP